MLIFAFSSEITVFEAILLVFLVVLTFLVATLIVLVSFLLVKIGQKSDEITKKKKRGTEDEPRQNLRDQNYSDKDISEKKPESEFSANVEAQSREQEQTTELAAKSSDDFSTDFDNHADQKTVELPFSMQEDKRNNETEYSKMIKTKMKKTKNIVGDIELELLKAKEKASD